MLDSSIFNVFSKDAGSVEWKREAAILKTEGIE